MLESQIGRQVVVPSNMQSVSRGSVLFHLKISLSLSNDQIL